MSYRMGDFQEAYTCTQKALKIYPNHGDSKELLMLLQKMFSSMWQIFLPALFAYLLHPGHIPVTVRNCRITSHRWQELFNYRDGRQTFQKHYAHYCFLQCDLSCRETGVGYFSHELVLTYISHRRCFCTRDTGLTNRTHSISFFMLSWLLIYMIF